MRAHGIRDHLCAWIEDWLSDRQQRVLLNCEISDWQNVISGVPQRLFLGPMLFIIYVNNLKGNLLSKKAKFADDTKLGGKVICTKYCDIIQEDLNKLIDWSEKWLMSFNTEKCKVMHTGDKNPNFKYKMRDQELDKVKQEKDLGVIINCNLKVNNQCIAASKKANMMLGLITRNFDHKAPKVMKKKSIQHLSGHTLNMRFNSGHQTTLRTKTCWKEYRNERQKLFLHCVIYHMRND